MGFTIETLWVVWISSSVIESKGQSESRDTTAVRPVLLLYGRVRVVALMLGQLGL